MLIVGLGHAEPDSYPIIDKWRAIQNKTANSYAIEFAI